MDEKQMDFMLWFLSLSAIYKVCDGYCEEDGQDDEECDYSWWALWYIWLVILVALVTCCSACGAYRRRRQVEMIEQRAALARAQRHRNIQNSGPECVVYPGGPPEGHINYGFIPGPGGLTKPPAYETVVTGPASEAPPLYSQQNTALTDIEIPPSTPPASTPIPSEPPPSYEEANRDQS